MPNPWALEFKDANAVRSYPLAEDASGRDSTGTFRLPFDFLVGLYLPVDYGLDVDGAGFFLKALGVYANGFTVTLGYQPAAGGDAVDAATAFVPRAGHSPGRPYALGGVGDFADTVGRVVVGRFDGIDEQPAGQFGFAPADARVDPDCVQFTPRAVASLAAVNGTATSARLYGDVELVAGENFQITPVVVAGQRPRLVFSAVQGEGLNASCDCEADASAPPVRRVNGVTADPDGNLAVLGSRCLEVNVVGGGIELDDTCSAPCCTCEELEKIAEQLGLFGARATTVEGFVTRLQAQVTTMDQTVLGAKLNDQGCSNCT